MDKERLKNIISVLNRYELRFREKQFIEAVRQYYKKNGLLTEEQEFILEGIYREKISWIRKGIYLEKDFFLTKNKAQNNV
jgi:hypothetical protein